MKIISLKSLLLACAATVLVGCGDSETTITELDKTPTPIDNDHDNHEEELGKGRLAIADSEQALVHIFDLENNALVESISVSYTHLTLPTICSV